MMAKTNGKFVMIDAAMFPKALRNAVTFRAFRALINEVRLVVHGRHLGLQQRCGCRGNVASSGNPISGSVDFQQTSVSGGGGRRYSVVGAFMMMVMALAHVYVPRRQVGEDHGAIWARHNTQVVAHPRMFPKAIDHVETLGTLWATILVGRC